MTNKTSIESGRAEKAYEFVEGIIKDNTIKKKEYKSYVKRLAPLIQTNGFGNTIAFIYSKRNNDAYDKIYCQLERWLKETKLLDEGDKLIEIITKVDSKKYRQMTNESLALINWWRRFVDGLIDIESDS